ncbi:MAG: hypothetical protein OXF85_00725 [Candidatus Saccharibacteria bacterium]|nr:hypothetical protein [Candidatus Saccharibacteria bacterium]
MKAEFEHKFNQQALQIAELKAIIFGGKRPKNKPPKNKGQFNQQRGKQSFRRPIPKASEITTRTKFKLPACCQCGGQFKDGSLLERYIEDIPLQGLTVNYKAKLVELQLIER